MVNIDCFLSYLLFYLALPFATGCISFTEIICHSGFVRPTYIELFFLMVKSYRSSCFADSATMYED